ncbi:MAG: protein kinase [Candidatus Cloacimonetes bacterium]|nr:protein kinase [Candidatus Cloacimonadota bacterium]
MLFQVNALVGSFRIKSYLGKGGMGEVYLATDEFLDRQVALKVLNPQLTGDQHFIERFKQEARVQANLIHDNVVSLYSFMILEERYIMVMEYARGITLKELIMHTGPIVEERALRILRQIVDGLMYAHSKRFIHRDVKPSNIMIDPQDRVKILDFGIAKIIGNTGMTKTGAKLGTVKYMSPEQVKGGGGIDHRTDIFSLGVTFYEMLSGHVPFDSNTESDYEVMSKIVNDPLPDPRVHYHHISQKCVNLVSQMTQKDPADRFDDMKAVSQAIASLSDQKDDWVEELEQGHDPNETESIDEDEDESPEEPVENTKPKKKHRGLVWTIVLVVLITGGLLFNEYVLKVPVPYVDGMPVESAKQVIYQWDLNVGTITEEENDQSAGMVLYATPSSGRMYKGHGIDLVVGIRQRVELPNLAGMTAEKAYNIISELELAVGNVTEQENNDFVGRIIETNPPGSRISKGSSIDLVIGVIEKITIPDVLGMSRDYAISELHDAGLYIGSVYEREDKDNVGKVIEIIPASGRVEPGSYIELVIGKAPAPRYGSMRTIYTDDFSSKGRTWSDEDDSNKTWRTEGNVIKCFGKNTSFYYVKSYTLSQLNNYDYFEVSINAAHLSGSNTAHFGLIFGASGTDPSNRFGIRGDGSYYVGQYRGQWSGSTYTSSAVNKTRTWNKLTVIYDGSQFHFYCNGVFLRSQSGTVYGNSIGIYSDGAISEAWFDDLTVRAE